MLPEGILRGRVHGDGRPLLLRAVGLNQLNPVNLLEVVVAELDDGLANLVVRGAHEPEVLLLEVVLDELGLRPASPVADPPYPGRQIVAEVFARRWAVALVLGRFQILLKLVTPVQDGPLSPDGLEPSHIVCNAL